LPDFLPWDLTSPSLITAQLSSGPFLSFHPFLREKSTATADPSQPLAQEQVSWHVVISRPPDID